MAYEDYDDERVNMIVALIIKVIIWLCAILIFMGIISIALFYEIRW